VADGLAGALEELQEISRGIHPAILAQGGLAAALKILARRSAVPVELAVRAGPRLPEPVEVAAYYIVSEALTNTAKHAHASAVHVAVEARDGILGLSIRDDGRGGADPARGSGLIGLTDRVDALGGTIEVASPVGAGTTLLIRLPSTRADRAFAFGQSGSGNSACKDVPAPTGLCTVIVPPSASTRSLSPTRPVPRPGSAPPLPSSRTRRPRVWSAASTST